MADRLKGSFFAAARIEGMRNAIEMTRKRPVAGHSNAQKAYLKGIELLDPSHSHYILVEGCWCRVRGETKGKISLFFF